MERTLRQRISRIVRGLYTYGYLKYLKGMDIGKNCSVSKSATMERAYPKSVHIGDNTRISIEAMVLGHDYFRGKEQSDTYIGHNTSIGGRAIILPGLRIGNHCFIGAGAVVTKDIPDHCLAAGNPAKVLRVGIELNDHYQIINHGHKPSDDGSVLTDVCGVVAGGGKRLNTNKLDCISNNIYVTRLCA